MNYNKLIKAKNEYDLVTAAKNIRIELKQAFPNVKFSVKSRRFSMGDDINVSWTDGPPNSAVGKITGKYQGGSFDGMVDLYTHSASNFNELYGSSKYVFAQRDLSVDASLYVVDLVCKKYGVDKSTIGLEIKESDGYKWVQVGHTVKAGEEWFSVMMNRESFDIDFRTVKY